MVVPIKVNLTIRIGDEKRRVSLYLRVYIIHNKIIGIRDWREITPHRPKGLLSLSVLHSPRLVLENNRSVAENVIRKSISRRYEVDVNPCRNVENL